MGIETRKSSGKFNQEMNAGLNTVYTQETQVGVGKQTLWTQSRKPWGFEQETKFWPTKRGNNTSHENRDAGKKDVHNLLFFLWSEVLRYLLCCTGQEWAGHRETFGGGGWLVLGSSFPLHRMGSICLNFLELANHRWLLVSCVFSPLGIWNPSDQCFQLGKKDLMWCRKLKRTRQSATFIRKWQCLDPMLEPTKPICAGQRRFGQAAWQRWYGLCTSGLNPPRLEKWA